MRLSIVTISYNQAKFLETAVRSVIGQNFHDLEYIVVDAGSSDGSIEILRRYEKNIARLIVEPDRGPADGLNKGMKCATGDVIGYLNADDEYLPGVFRKVDQIFSERPGIDVLCGGGYIIDGDGRRVRRVFSDAFSVASYLYGGATILQQSTFFRRNAFEETSGFNISNKTSWDGELMLEFGRRNKTILTVDELWSLFRIYGGSISGSGATFQKYIADKKRMFESTYGRPWNRLDDVISVLCRLRKWIIHPSALTARVTDALRRVPA